jgi:hypothetical protein
VVRESGDENVGMYRVVARSVKTNEEVGRINFVADKAAGKFTTQYITTTDQPTGGVFNRDAAYRGDGLSTILFNEALRVSGGSQAFSTNAGIMKDVNARSFMQARQQLLNDPQSEFYLPKHPKLSSLLKISESRTLTSNEKEKFADELALEQKLNQKAFIEGTASGRLYQKAGYLPTHVDFLIGPSGPVVPFQTERVLLAAPVSGQN